MLPSTVDGKSTSTLSEFTVSDPVAHQAMQAADLITVRGPYIPIAVVFTILFFVFVFVFVKLPRTISHGNPLKMQELGATFKRLFKNCRYIEGVIAQALYAGVQIRC